ncbi:MAG: glycosyl hydrolase family 88 [Clostridiales bacterium]|nr:glycosyl hydrolase family 88 [Clostridiales bacterium]
MKNLLNLEKYIENYYNNPYTMINRFYENKEAEKWNYADAYILQAFIQMYKATNFNKYKDFVLNYLDKFVDYNGTIKKYSKSSYNIDSIAGGIPLIFAFENTYNNKYKIAFEKLAEQLYEQPRISSGNFWHKKIYPNQVWLDGLFMSQPFYAEYETKYNNRRNYNDIINQFRNIRKYMFDENYKLYYHGYDETHKIFWANKDTGCSGNFWSRSIGWFIMAVVDTAEKIKDNDKKIFDELSGIYKEIIDSLLMYRKKDDGLICQLTVFQSEPNNYTETSASAMIISSILKAFRINMINDKDIFIKAKKMFESLITHKLVKKDGTFVLEDTVFVSGLGPADNLRRDGSKKYYLSEPKMTDSPIGTASIITAYSQWLMINNT